MIPLRVENRMDWSIIDGALKDWNMWTNNESNDFIIFNRGSESWFIPPQNNGGLNYGRWGSRY